MKTGYRIWSSNLQLTHSFEILHLCDDKQRFLHLAGDLEAVFLVKTAFDAVTAWLTCSSEVRQPKSPKLNANWRVN